MVVSLVCNSDVCWVVLTASIEVLRTVEMWGSDVVGETAVSLVAEKAEMWDVY